MKLLPTMPQGFLAKLFSEMFRQGFQLEDWAHDLRAAGFSEEQVEVMMQARSSGIAAPDGGASRQPAGAGFHAQCGDESCGDGHGGWSWYRLIYF
ncbi:MAG: hypothetical protein LRY50_14240 [Geovibrio sp.]|nr:hypothetical protein [Geovibrio sp.]